MKCFESSPGETFLVKRQGEVLLSLTCLAVEFKAPAAGAEFSTKAVFILFALSKWWKRPLDLMSC